MAVDNKNLEQDSFNDNSYKNYMELIYIDHGAENDLLDHLDEGLLKKFEEDIDKLASYLQKEEGLQVKKEKVQWSRATIKEGVPAEKEKELEQVIGHSAPLIAEYPLISAEGEGVGYIVSGIHHSIPFPIVATVKNKDLGYTLYQIKDNNIEKKLVKASMEKIIQECFCF